MSTTNKTVKHTPGPWRPVTGQGAHHRDWYIRCDLGRTSTGDAALDYEGRAVAKTCSTMIGSMETVEANARLIAAAPELLAACEEMAAIGNEIEVIGAKGYADAIGAIRAAIAKATGGAA